MAEKPLYNVNVQMEKAMQKQYDKMLKAMLKQIIVQVKNIVSA